MVDVFSKTKRSKVMSRIRSRNTLPELELRRALHKVGYRFRLHVKTLAGKPDIVLAAYRCAIQVRGCFWHGHDCIDGHIPKSHGEYWKPKLARNKRNDRRNDRIMRKEGWAVAIVWECRTKTRASLERQVKRISRILEGRRPSE